MDASLYFPFLRGRVGEIEAVGRLSPLARARIALVVDLPVKELAVGQTLDEYVGGFVSSLATAWGTRRLLYIDLNRYGPEHLDRFGRPIVQHLYDCARQKRLAAIPIAAPDRGPGTSYNTAVARIAAQDGRGAAIRVPYEDFSDTAALQTVLASTLRELSLPATSVDVFLDAGSLAEMPAELADEDHLFTTLVQALGVVHRYAFRMVVFAGSSVPESLPAKPENQPRVIRRTEFLVWKRLCALPNPQPVRFGDTGIWSPRQLDAGGGGGGPPPARVRIPLPDRQIFLRDDASRYRACCQAALRYPGIEALPACWGLDSLRGVALGSMGPEAATAWVARDTNTHIELTVRLTQTRMAAAGLLESIPLASVIEEPWSQASLPMA